MYHVILSQQVYLLLKLNVRELVAVSCHIYQYYERNLLMNYQVSTNYAMSLYNSSPVAPR